MRPIHDRLQSALAPAYALERELARGSTSYVFLARDVALERHVAVKLLRPELATAEQVERFVRESRILAQVAHPNILPVHSAGEADGLYYSITEYIVGDTLRARLQSGPLAVREAVALGADVLAGLAAAHGAGIIHRDIKPENILLAGGRVLLADFGIAHCGSAAAAAQDRGAGTPMYMAPEQQRGESNQRTDIYAVGLVLYESITGRAWSAAPPADRERWSGVPRDLAAILRRALQPDPAARWPDAATFRAALLAAGSRVSRAVAVTAASTAVALLAAAGIWHGARAPAAASLDLTIVPFATGPGVPQEYGEHVAVLVAQRLGSVDALRIGRRHGATFRAWERGLEHETPARVAAALRTQHYASGELEARNGGIEARVALYDATGRVLPLVHVAASADYVEVADAIAFELLRTLRPRLAGSYRPIETLSRQTAALAEWLRGEAAVNRNEWVLAQRHFETALALDTTFLLAAARLDEVRIWLPWEEHGSRVDLRRLYERHGDRLHAVDRLIIEGRLQPRGEARLRAFAAARNAYPLDAQAAVYYADELLHRGPLLGYGIAEAIDAFGVAVALDSFFGPAYEHMAWALIRLGDEPAAAAAVARFAALTPRAEEGSLHSPVIFEAAHALRFERADADAYAAEFASVATRFEYLLRVGVGFDAPDAQRRIGAAVARNASPAIRARGHQAHAVALLALGRATEALAHLDSVALLVNTPAARLQAAEWRVLPPALGWPAAAVDAAERERGLAALEAALLAPATVTRAAWALAVDAIARGDSAAARRRHDAFLVSAHDSATTRLAVLLDALAHGAAGRYRRALDVSQPLLQHAPDERLGHPFARAALYLARGAWHEAGDATAADRSWLWYEHTDINALAGEIQPVEVDWVFGTYASHRRALAALSRSDLRTGCAQLLRARRLWSAADNAFLKLLHAADEAAADRCSA